MKNLALLSATVGCATSGLIFSTTPAASALSWNWSYSGTGIAASGTFTTENTPNNLGFYLITGITGTRNGELITGLQATGTSIPGNEPFLVDNLIRRGSEQLKTGGFGYSTVGENYSNPFFASFLPTPSYLEVFSKPPYTGSEVSELPVSFSATLIAVPETTSTRSLLVFGIGSAVAILKRQLKPAEKDKTKIS